MSKQGRAEATDLRWKEMWSVFSSRFLFIIRMIGGKESLGKFFYLLGVRVLGFILIFIYGLFGFDLFIKSVGTKARNAIIPNKISESEVNPTFFILANVMPVFM